MNGAIYNHPTYPRFFLFVYIFQRVPVTEKSGRVHTSAVTVAILPQADQVCFCFNHLFVHNTFMMLPHSYS